MAQVTIIGKINAGEKIELTKCLQNIDDNFKETNTDPCEFLFIELISMGYTTEGEDLIFCHNGDRDTSGCLFLGHFNDGIV